MIHWKKYIINLGYVPGRVASDSKPLAIVLSNNPIIVVYPAWTTSAGKKASAENEEECQCYALCIE
jgi:hypothetical protein